MTTSNDPQAGGWCTNWAAYDVPTLWKMLQGEDPFRTSEHVSAWRMTYELLSTHMAELQRCRDDLAAKWSAASSPAATAFLSYVDAMLSSMKQTGDAAVSTYDGLAGINGALITAKAEIGKLHDQWQKYQHEEDSSFGIGSWHPFANTPDNWKEQLRSEAAKHMVAADTAVFDSSTKLTPAPPYSPYGNLEQRQSFPADGRSSGSDSGGASAQSRGSWAQPPFIPAPAPVPPPVPVAPSQSGHDALLAGGVAAPVMPAPSAGPTPVTTAQPPSGPALPPTGLIGPRAGFLSERVLGRRGPIESPTRTEVSGRSPTGISGEPGGIRGRMAPGGVIGGEPAVSRPTPSGMRRVNPVGGLIGERPSGGTAAAEGQPIGVAGQRGAGRRRDDSDQHFDPDNPWATEEGVPAVLKPQAEAMRHDAGPGVIGIDR